MIRIAYYFIFVLGCGFAAFEAQSPWNGVAGGILGGFFLMGSDVLLNNMDRFIYLWKSLIYCRQYVRLSISYLYRIKINGKYLLVKGNRIAGQYQPVGGGIKRYPSSGEFFNSITAKEDLMFPIDTASEDDLRIRIPGIKLFKFMQWFDSAKGREIDTWREFYEELIASEILPGDKFGYIKTNYLYRHISPIKFSKFADMKELLIAEIYEVIPSEEQKEELKKLIDVPSDKYIWATENEICKLGAISGQNTERRIAPTAEWTL